MGDSVQDAANGLRLFKCVSAQRDKTNGHDDSVDGRVKATLEAKRLGPPIYPFLATSKSRLCVIFTLFSSSLPGYVQDERDTARVFGHLGYEVVIYRNLTQKQLLMALEDQRNRIHEQQQPAYDRLVFVFLSHGKEGGLLTCADEQGMEVEMISDSTGCDQQTLITSIGSIVDIFRHDRTPNLKGVPKLFLIQACRGDSQLKAASRPNMNQRPSSSLPVPVLADNLIAYATVQSYPSFVSKSNGSWFIQAFLDFVRQHNDHMHVMDILTLVNGEVAAKKGAIEGDSDPVVQMPIFASTLRKQFFLSNPLK